MIQSRDRGFMKKLCMLLLVCLPMSSLANDMPWVERMKTLDTELFESFNHCQDPKELSKHASYFSTDVEFYHDNSGVI
ncbi:MAG: hypothetical protein ACJAS9_004017 [Polaribacter sp.]|jgi:hypothetical protein